MNRPTDARARHDEEAVLIALVGIEAVRVRAVQASSGRKTDSVRSWTERPKSVMHTWNKRASVKYNQVPVETNNQCSPGLSSDPMLLL